MDSSNTIIHMNHHSHSSALALYYIAVGSRNQKLDTLVELISALKYDDRSMSVVICVSSRDHVDDIVLALKGSESQLVGRVNVWCLHADLGEREVTSYVNQFRDVSRQSVLSIRDEDVPSDEWNTAMEQQSEDSIVARQEHPLHVLITTDAPLQTLLKMNFDPLSPTVLIHYDVPRRKEDYTRRHGSILGSRSRHEGRRIAMCFVEAGKVDMLHQFEEFAERKLREIPVHVKDIFHC